MIEEMRVAISRQIKNGKWDKVTELEFYHKGVHLTLEVVPASVQVWLVDRSDGVTTRVNITGSLDL